MRKSHITALIAGGANIKAVAARVGHRDITTTLKTYTALTASMQDELHALVESLAAANYSGPSWNEEGEVRLEPETLSRSLPAT